MGSNIKRGIHCKNPDNNSRAMPSHRPVTTEDQVPFLTRPCGRVGYQRVIGTGFSTEQGPLLFLLSVSLHQHSAFIHSFITDTIVVK